MRPLLAGDLYKLGFIPEGAPDPATSGLVEPLGKILKQLSQGGGAKSFNIDEVRLELDSRLVISELVKTRLA